jgi:hypothetical protein
MKKAIGIIVLGLLWCNVAFASSAETFILTCSGKKKTIDIYQTSYDSFYEDFTVYVNLGKINGIYTDATNSWLKRSGSYPEINFSKQLESGGLVDDSGKLEISYDGNVLRMTDGYKAGEKSDMEEYQGTISLSSIPFVDSSI